MDRLWERVAQCEVSEFRPYSIIQPTPAWESLDFTGKDDNRNISSSAINLDQAYRLKRLSALSVFSSRVPYTGPQALARQTLCFCSARESGSQWDQCNTCFDTDCVAVKLCLLPCSHGNHCLVEPLGRLRCRATSRFVCFFGFRSE